MRSEQTGSLITTYTWDEENRLTNVQYGDGSVDTYVYFQDGRRWRAQSTLGPSTTTTLFIWDGLNLLLEENESLIARVQWTNFPEEAREVLVMREVGTTGLSNGASFFPGFDLSGNTRLMVGAAGISKWRGLYKSFGEERALIGYGGQVAQSTLGAGYGGQTSGLATAQRYGGQVGSTFEAALNHLRFGGQVGYYTDRNGRIYVRARHYDSRTGRWLSRDPIGFAGGDWNLYGYVGNNTPNRLDSSGLQAQNWWGNHLTHSEALQEAKRRAKISIHQSPIAQWRIGPKQRWVREPVGFIHNNTESHQGIIRAYDTPAGIKFIVEHPYDPKAVPHFHAAQPPEPIIVGGQKIDVHIKREQLQRKLAQNKKLRQGIMRELKKNYDQINPKHHINYVLRRGKFYGPGGKVYTREQLIQKFNNLDANTQQALTRAKTHAERQAVIEEAALWREVREAVMRSGRLRTLPALRTRLSVQGAVNALNWLGIVAIIINPPSADQTRREIWQNYLDMLRQFNPKEYERVMSMYYA